MRAELGGSSGSPSFCNAIWPRRDRYQLMKTLAALGWEPWLGVDICCSTEKLAPSFQRLVSNISIGSP